MSKCSEEGCTYFAGSSGYCSSHTEEGKAQSAAKELEKAAKKERNLQEIRQGPAWWRDNRIRYPVGYQVKSLILGASPTEGRRGRDYYDDPNVFLLGREEVKNAPRYIHADYSPDVRDPELTAASNDYENTFDEIAFDGSTMCTFHGPPDSMVPVFGYFYKMLKDEGVFFLSDYTPEIKMALEMNRFLVHRVNVAHLRGTIVERLRLQHFDPDLNYVCVAIKRPVGGAAAPAPPQGGMRKLRKVRKSKKTRKAKKTRRH